jgi:hypothetical protein
LRGNELHVALLQALTCNSALSAISQARKKWRTEVRH